MSELQCNHCGEWKDEDEFNWRWKSLGVRARTCRDCSKSQKIEHYKKHYDDELKRVGSVTRNKRDAAQEFIYGYLSESVCADCGEYDFSVLTFDHVRGEKKTEVSAMVSQGYSIEAIMDEIAKCDIVCFNCHMRREQQRRSGGRFSRFWPKFPGEE